MTDKLIALREQIDAIDAHILALLSRRAGIAQAVGQVKAETKAAVLRPEREAQVLRGVAGRNPGPLHEREVQTVFREIISSCRALEQRVTVAYPGADGALGRQAAVLQFGSAIEGLPCFSIEDVFRAVETGVADHGVVPIEHAPGHLLHLTVDLMLATTSSIGGEVWVPGRHGLMTMDGTMDGVKSVCATAQALRQCRPWLDLHYPALQRRAVAASTEAAALASGDLTLAAITSESAGQQYGLGVVQAHIGDDPHQRTRFVVIGRHAAGPSGVDRTSLVVSAPYQPGAIHALPLPLTGHGIAMTRLAPCPARTPTGEYCFYVEVEGHIADAALASAIEELKHKVAFVKVLGSYPAGLQGHCPAP